MGDEKKMREEFLKQEGAIPEQDTEQSGQVWPRAFGVSTPELSGEMEDVEPATDEDRTDANTPAGESRERRRRD